MTILLADIPCTIPEPQAHNQTVAAADRLSVGSNACPVDALCSCEQHDNKSDPVHMCGNGCTV